MDKVLKKIAVSCLLALVLLFLVLYTLGVFSALKNNFQSLSLLFTVLDLLIRVNVLWIGLVIFLENKNPSRTIAWLVVLVLLPLVGFFIYIVFGRSYHKKIKAASKGQGDSNRMAKAAEIQIGLVDYLKLPNSENPSNRRLMQLLLKNAKTPFSLSNEVKVLTNGLNKFYALTESILKAKHHIHLEYFIIKDDVVGEKIASLLIEKAKEGVEVRVIYDDVGSWELGKAYINRLKSAGVEIYPFFKVVFPVFSRELNYRNHRKIAIVDGETAFLGGLNIGDEYIGGGEKFSFWRDTHLEIHGEAVYALQSIFLNDWNYVSKQNVSGVAYFPENKVTNHSLVQIAASGPDSEWKCILQAFYRMIANAQEKLWIASPYLVPEESLLMGLKTAALSGVDVKIIIPSRPDHFFVYWASQSNIQSLLEAGVKIYSYQNGFIHSKIVIVDRQSASVGTANLDIRSMEINFEVNAFLYDVEVIKRLEDDFLLDLEASEEIVLERFKKRRWQRKFLEALGRLVSPLQ